MTAGTPLTEPQKRRIRALHKKGLGRNAIAREAGVSLASVTKVCADAGLTFDRAATKVAVEARSVDLRARRQAIVQRLYGRAEKNLDRLEHDGYTYTVILAGGAEEGARTSTVTDEDPPSADERNHSTAINTYLTAAAKLEQIDGDSTVSKVASTITQLAARFGINDA